MMFRISSAAYSAEEGGICARGNPTSIKGVRSEVFPADDEDFVHDCTMEGESDGVVVRGDLTSSVGVGSAVHPVSFSKEIGNVSCFEFELQNRGQSDLAVLRQRRKMSCNHQWSVTKTRNPEKQQGV